MSMPKRLLPPSADVLLEGMAVRVFRLPRAAPFYAFQFASDLPSSRLNEWKWYFQWLCLSLVLMKGGWVCLLLVHAVPVRKKKTLNRVEETPQQ